MHRRVIKPYTLTIDDTLLGLGGVEFSPNEKLLYISNGKYLYQLDLDSLAFDSIPTLIGTYDGFAYPQPSFTTTIYLLKAAPDGKIYGSNSGNTNFFHEINNPNVKGLACNFTQHSFYCGVRKGPTMPNMPNYALGPLPGSVCDTLGLGVVPHSLVEVGFGIYPNPTSNELTISKPAINCVASILSLDGKVVFTEKLNNTNKATLALSNLANGTYFITFTNDNLAPITIKFTKQ